MGSFIVGSGNVFESLLSGSIPDLEFDSAARRLKSSDFKVNADCWKEAVWDE
jgi:hypothetical protein